MTEDITIQIWNKTPYNDLVISRYIEFLDDDGVRQIHVELCQYGQHLRTHIEAPADREIQVNRIERLGSSA